mmetsp:Transcript_4633/g.11630  ORF Transcript_4633/g.11630 Transcript_4633/m.11630 type:complete len:209 (+) Transcript_4633:347-973(+)
MEKSSEPNSILSFHSESCNLNSCMYVALALPTDTERTRAAPLLVKLSAKRFYTPSSSSSPPFCSHWIAAYSKSVWTRPEVSCSRRAQLASDVTHASEWSGRVASMNSTSCVSAPHRAPRYCATCAWWTLAASSTLRAARSTGLFTSLAQDRMCSTACCRLAHQRTVASGSALPEAKPHLLTHTREVGEGSRADQAAAVPRCWSSLVSW